MEHLRAERELRQQAARAAERSRITAEMQDVLAHRLSLIALHTGELTTKAGALPPQVADRLMLLRTASTQALTELRDVLGALLDTATTSGRPAPVLRDLDELVEEARTAGQHVDIDVDGHPGQAPTAHRLAVYRIVQEAMSNARKHAHGAGVRIRLHYVVTEIVIDRPCMEVAAYAADPTHAPDWYANIESVKWQTDPPVRIGSRVDFVARFLGRRLAYTYEVIEIVPGDRLVMRTAQGPFPIETSYLWQAVDAGHTRMTLRNRGEPAGFGKIAAPVLAAAIRRANDKDLAAIKRVLESG